MKLKMMTYNRYLDCEGGWQFEWDTKDLSPGKVLLRCYSSEDLRSEICEGIFEDSWRKTTSLERELVDRTVRILSCPSAELENAYKKLFESQSQLARLGTPRPSGLDGSAFKAVLPQMLVGWRELILASDTGAVFRNRLKEVKVIAI